MKQLHTHTQTQTHTQFPPPFLVRQDCHPGEGRDLVTLLGIWQRLLLRNAAVSDGVPASAGMTTLPEMQKREEGKKVWVCAFAKIVNYWTPVVK